MMGHKCLAYKISDILLVVGGLNWGLVALNYNLVDMLFGAGSTLSRIVYGLVGLSALVVLGHMAGMCKCTKDACKDGKCEMHGGMSKGSSMEGRM